MRRTLRDLRELASQVNNYIATRSTDALSVRKEFEQLRDQFLARTCPNGYGNLYTGSTDTPLTDEEAQLYQYLWTLVWEPLESNAA